MTEDTLETQNNTYTQDNATTNKHLLAIAEETIKKLKKIKEEAQAKLEQIKFELEITLSDSKEAKKLKEDEVFYNKVISEVNMLETSVNQKSSELKNPQTQSQAQTQVKDVIVDVRLPQNRNKQENKEKTDADMIMKLRGLTPGQNLFLREEQEDVLKIIKADISYISLDDRHKIGQLRKGLGAYHIGNRKANARKERQLTKREREMFNTYSYSRSKERGERSR